MVAPAVAVGGVQLDLGLLLVVVVRVVVQVKKGVVGHQLEKKERKGKV